MPPSRLPFDKHFPGSDYFSVCHKAVQVVTIREGSRVQLHLPAAGTTQFQMHEHPSVQVGNPDESTVEIVWKRVANNRLAACRIGTVLFQAAAGSHLLLRGL